MIHALLRARSVGLFFELPLPSSRNRSKLSRRVAPIAAAMPARRSSTAATVATSTTPAPDTAAATDAKKPATRPRRGADAAQADAAQAAAADAAAEAPSAPLAKKSPKSSSSSGPTRDREARLWAKGHAAVAGVDEAGRGPLAGPVVAAACVLPAGASFPGLDDSKKLDEPAREALYGAITGHPGVAWCVRVEDHVSIDRVNILQATMRAMRRAVEGLAGGGGGGGGGDAAAAAGEDAAGARDAATGFESDDPDAENCADAAAIPDPRARRSRLRASPDYALIDGNRVPAGLPCAAEAVVGGDGKVCAIAAASVIAKVTRDRIMLDLERAHPGYGLGRHKGYGVPEHVAAIRRLGPSDVHRRSFQPVRDMLGWTREAMLEAEAAAAAAAAVGAGAVGATTKKGEGEAEGRARKRAAEAEPAVAAARGGARRGAAKARATGK
jgi:ribonuclease HII